MINKIPLTVGVTGHINLREQDRDVLCRAVKNELSSLREKYPHTPLKMINALAAGADLLCAEAAEEMGIPLIAALPMAEAEYRRDFNADDGERLNHQLQRAETVTVVPATEGEAEGGGRPFRYRQAGIWIAEHSHIVLALWDGKEESKNEAGTAAVVRCALEGNWNPVSGLPVSSGDNTGVIHILTPRKDDGQDGAGQIRKLGNTGTLEEILNKTEEFNRLAETRLPKQEPLLPADDSRDPELQKLDEIYQTADGLSMRFAKQYRGMLAGLALTGTALTMAFLLYDEAELTWMILLCGAVILIAFLLLRRAGRTACHRRFIEYRVLAETLRVQLFLRFAGSGLQAQRVLPWTQKQETAWILCAVCALNAAPLPERREKVLDCWVKAQLDYHRQAGKRTAAKHKKQGRILGCAMVLSIIGYLFLLVYELTCGGLIFSPVYPPADPERVRTVMKAVLGTLSAGTLFMASYYGKMSLSRVTGDHEKMTVFYQKAADRIVRCGENEQMLETLAREELTENGNWSSYQRDNAPELNV